MAEELEHIDLHAEDVQDILGQQPTWMLRKGLYIVAAFVTLLLVGAWLFKYPQTVRGTLTLTSLDPPANITAKASGSIKQVFVKDGQEVKKNTRLAVIENPASTEDVYTVEKLLGQLRTAIDEQSVFFLPKTSLELGGLQSNYSALLLKLDSYNQFIQLGIYQKKIAAQKQLNSVTRSKGTNVKLQKKLAAQQYELQRKALLRNKTLYEKELISAQEYEQTKLQLVQNELSIKAAEASVMDNSSQQLELAANIMELQQTYTEKLSNLTIDLRTAIEQLSSAISTWKLTYMIISPTNGYVTFTNVWAANQNVESGKTVFSVVSKRNPQLVGKLQMAADGAGRVKKGQQVNVYFNNFPENEFGMVKGRVQRISLIPNSDNKYVVEVTFPNGLRTTYGKQLPLSMEMTANAKIITEDTRLLEQLFLPLKQLYKNNTTLGNQQ